MEQNADGNEPARHAPWPMPVLLLMAVAGAVLITAMFISLRKRMAAPCYEDSKSCRAWHDEQTLTRAIRAFQIRFDRIPDRLDELMTPPDGGKPFMESKQNLIDPWGSPYHYDAAGLRNQGHHPDIWCVTPDGNLVGNWMEPH